MKSMQREDAFTELVEAWSTLVKEGARFGADLLRSVSPSLTSAASLVSSAGQRATRGCSCEIPPACWLPVDEGTVRTSACADTNATLKITVMNCGPTPRTVSLSSGAAGATGGVAISPATLTVQPMDEGTATATVAVAQGSGQQHLIWVRGCKSHVVRWIVSPGSRCDGSSSLTIQDCPDTVHHWYDHFYCQHPCQG